MRPSMSPAGRWDLKSSRPPVDHLKMTQRPLVSVLVAAHDAAEGVVASLDSALAQDYPAERLEVVIVVAESAREAAAGYAELFPRRVRVIAQPDAGPLAAMERALHEARGELIAPLEPGDRWPVGRISAQAAALEEWRDVGLVYSELVGLDDEPPSGQPVAQLLREAPCIAASSIMLRASLLPALGPLPAELPRAPWWLAVRAACVAKIAWVPAGAAATDDAPDDAAADVARPRRAAGDPLAGARRFVTLAFAEELLQHRELLAAYGARFDGNADATLAIDASTLLPAAAGRALGALVSDLGLDADGTAHLIAVLGPIDASVRAQLPQHADALLTLREPAAAAAGGEAPVPAFDADSIDALRELARHATAA
jgi:hypothetical protein